MASRRSLLEEDLTCPVCCDIFNDPLILLCSHSICKDCLEQFWRQKNAKECPICRKRSSVENPPRNLSLRNLCEAFLKEKIQKAAGGSEVLCILHGERLKLFCQDDKQPICVVCQASRKHSGHKFLPIDEAAQDYKEQLKAAVKALEEKLKVLKTEKIKWTCDQTASHIKVQAQQTEMKIKAAFQKLHKFLKDEEENRIRALREEEKQKSLMRRKKTEEINKEISTLSDKITSIEKQMRAGDIILLQNIKDIKNRTQMKPLNPVMYRAPVIDVAKHLGNLESGVWVKIKSHITYAPVILDPNTASANLCLSDDLTCVEFNHERQALPVNPERFVYWDCVLGSKAFESGVHSWEVDVKSNKFWDVGVTIESNKERGSCFSWENVWTASFRDGHPHHPGQNIHRLSQPVNAIQVELDMDKGKLSFSDPGTNERLHTFHVSFDERVYPFFHTLWPSSPLMISPEMYCSCSS